MNIYRFDRPLEKPKYITVQGQARGGKGSLVRSLVAKLEKEFRVLAIDQGMKFRVFAYLALQDHIDYEDLSEIRRFVMDEGNQQRVLIALQEAAKLSKPEVDDMYYRHEISNVAGMFGKVSETHEVVVGILLDEVRAAQAVYDIVVVDGRAMYEYGKQLAKEGVVDYVLAVDVLCEPLTAARRVTGIFEPVEKLSQNELIQLIYTTQDISRRNSSDARRKRDPSVYLHEAFEFDVLHVPGHDSEFARMVDKVAEVGVLSLDNSFTRSVGQFTEPAVRLIYEVVANRKNRTQTT